MKYTLSRRAVGIAQRLSTERSADRIYVLDKGQLAVQDSHDELTASNGIYALLWGAQTGATM